MFAYSELSREIERNNDRDDDFYILIVIKKKVLRLKYKTSKSIQRLIESRAKVSD